jgi:hypothetical protein
LDTSFSNGINNQQTPSTGRLSRPTAWIDWSLLMPIAKAELSPTDRLREVASILARGADRWRRQVKSGLSMPDSASSKLPETGLATCSETGVSVSRAHGLHLRDDGDMA